MLLGRNLRVLVVHARRRSLRHTTMTVMRDRHMATVDVQLQRAVVTAHHVPQSLPTCCPRGVLYRNQGQRRRKVASSVPQPGVYAHAPMLYMLKPQLLLWRCSQARRYRFSHSKISMHLPMHFISPATWHLIMSHRIASVLQPIAKSITTLAASRTFLRAAATSSMLGGSALMEPLAGFCICTASMRSLSVSAAWRVLEARSTRISADMMSALPGSAGCARGGECADRDCAG